MSKKLEEIKPCLINGGCFKGNSPLENTSHYQVDLLDPHVDGYSCLDARFKYFKLERLNGRSIGVASNNKKDWYPVDGVRAIDGRIIPVNEFNQKYFTGVDKIVRVRNV